MQKDLDPLSIMASWNSENAEADTTSFNTVDIFDPRRASSTYMFLKPFAEMGWTNKPQVVLTSIILGSKLITILIFRTKMFTLPETNIAHENPHVSL